MIKFFLFVILSFTFSFNICCASVYVHGYTKEDGTYVNPHYRSEPDSSIYNNWSYYGNTNPYTGKTGKKKDDKADTYNAISTTNENIQNEILNKFPNIKRNPLDSVIITTIPNEVKLNDIIINNYKISDYNNKANDYKLPEIKIEKPDDRPSLKELVANHQYLNSYDIPSKKETINSTVSYVFEHICFFMIELLKLTYFPSLLLLWLFFTLRYLLKSLGFFENIIISTKTTILLYYAFNIISASIYLYNLPTIASSENIVMRRFFYELLSPTDSYSLLFAFSISMYFISKISIKTINFFKGEN